nr:uncharacterized protein LOC112034911 [Quercus suber]
MVKLNHLTFGCSICPLTILAPIGEKHLVKLMQMELINLRLKYLPQNMRWRKLGSIWYTSKTSRIPIKLLHNAATTVCSMRIWVISIMIITIQLQKVSEISEAMMGLDLAEKATLMRNHSWRGFIGSEDLWLILRILVKGKFFTSENGYFGYFVGVQETKTIEMSSINGYAFINVWRNFCFSNILYYWDCVDSQILCPVSILQHGCKSWESH